MDIAEDEGWRQLLSPYLAGDRIYAIRIRITGGREKNATSAGSPEDNPETLAEDGSRSIFVL